MGQVPVHEHALRLPKHGSRLLAEIAGLERQSAGQMTRIVEMQHQVQAQFTTLATLDQARRVADQQTRSDNRRHAELTAKLRDTETQRSAADLARTTAEAELQQLRLRHHLVISSTLWRVSAPLRRFGNRLPRWMRRALRVPVWFRKNPSSPLQAPSKPLSLPLTTEARRGSPARPPSELFKSQEAGWRPPNDRSEFKGLRDLVPRSPIAVVAHIFYPELWPEIAAAINHIANPFDLFVTLVRGNAESLHETILQDYPYAHVVTVDNHGRDILPLLNLLQAGALDQYQLICKVHTKRSFWHEDGETWRRNLIVGLLGCSALVADVLTAFRSDPDLGMVVADGQIYAGREMWLGNAVHLERLFQNFDIDDTAFDKSFAGGSMYWIRADLLQYLVDLNIGFDDFEPEPLGADGSMAHALERLVSLVCYHAGATIKETSAVVQDDSEPRGALVLAMPE